MNCQQFACAPAVGFGDPTHAQLVGFIEIDGQVDDQDTFLILHVADVCQSTSENRG